MEQRTEKIRVRLTEKELEHLKKCSSASNNRFQNGRTNFSEYLREQLLTGSRYTNGEVVRQLRELKYELRKIGTNVNQIAKKVNSGLGTSEDLYWLTEYLTRIEAAFKKLEQEADATWRSRN